MPEGVVLRSAKEIQDREEYKRRLLLNKEVYFLI